MGPGQPFSWGAQTLPTVIFGGWEPSAKMWESLLQVFHVKHPVWGWSAGSHVLLIHPLPRWLQPQALTPPHQQASRFSKRIHFSLTQCRFLCFVLFISCKWRKSSYSHTKIKKKKKQPSGGFGLNSIDGNSWCHFLFCSGNIHPWVPTAQNFLGRATGRDEKTPGTRQTQPLARA